jgi:hypothetical protein
MVETPVLFIIFNRPDLTEKVFAAIRQAKPRNLYVAADGPRTTEEIALTEAARKVTEQVDWPCTVHRRYQEANLGCALGVSSAITWFFEYVEEGIILEDDCLPHPDFFSFCSALLERYRHDARVMHVGGTSFLPFKLKESYYFTNYTHIWGWATWRRAWGRYDLSMQDWPVFKGSDFIAKRLRNKRAESFWHESFDFATNKTFNNWDYQWTFTVWKKDGYAIAPSLNLVSNIGFRKDGTHTKGDNRLLSNLPAVALGNMIHPAEVEIDRKADSYVGMKIYLSEPSELKKLSSYLRLVSKKL